MLSRPAGEKQRETTIVLPNEILLSFDPGLAQSQVQTLLNRHDLEIIRPLRFTQNRYLVRSRKASGTDILNIANRLATTPGIQSSTPNFVQSIQYEMQDQAATGAANSNSIQRISQLLAKLPQPEDSPLMSNLLPLQWHLDSTPRRGRLQPRTDIRATEAWRNSQKGKDVVVAVIDSVIQWDHPDLVQQVYQAKNINDLLPGETQGWDFTSDNGGDPDTRMSAAELKQLRPIFQQTFTLSDAEILKQYADLATRIRRRYKDYSDGQVAALIRSLKRSQIAAEFRGTWAAGVIAANPHSNQGAFGVEPDAKILPVRVFGIDGEITEERLIEAIGYAAARGVNVINMSLGGLLPSQGLTDQVFKVLDANPNLSIVASAGNESLDGVAFPAAIPGVISVGATSMEGTRSFYSSYGGRLDVVAPGGETQLSQQGGIFTTGGTGVAGFWEGITPPKSSWNMTFDPKGDYIQVQGTSFSAPIVSGVVALMQGERQGQLKRDRITSILKKTASFQPLQISSTDTTQYRLQSAIGFGTADDFPYLRPSGIFPRPRPISAEQYYYGNGLVNAAAAVEAAK
ncbi:S8 family serine peptidase [Leptolyngbya boryana CZ1]|uniref:S8 family serine peptidase n=1 Tax=Leptolyngbya boryana CZ1 TaxID=3060204 RepID=A0AA96WQJ0_LEPBY|nr:S8 family serine peptidase [Leptolyngbya boryana]WNZ44061.1 S8 family serine peptidase [Leptolyngbya boryana CZ1]